MPRLCEDDRFQILDRIDLDTSIVQIFSQLSAILPRAYCSAQLTDIRGVSKQGLENLAPDRIHLKGLLFYGKHGVLPEVGRGTCARHSEGQYKMTSRLHVPGNAG